MRVPAVHAAVRSPGQVIYKDIALTQAAQRQTAEVSQLLGQVRRRHAGLPGQSGAQPGRQRYPH